MAKLIRRKKSLYLTIAILLLLAALSTALYFRFIKDDNKEQRGTYVFHHKHGKSYSNVFFLPKENRNVYS
ncbi:MAG: hypothetical protein GX957_07165 [Clostridiaceae bacterium]|nr:hypothetical protein [Clostridiaceae bacterium]